MTGKLFAILFSIIPLIGLGQGDIDTVGEFCLKKKDIHARILGNSICGVMDTVLCLVTGKIVDEKKAPIESVDIKITNRSTKEMVVVESDSLGNFKKFIEPGTYDLRIGHSGYGEISLTLSGLTSGQMQCILVDLGSRNVIQEYIRIKAKEIRKE